MSKPVSTEQTAHIGVFTLMLMTAALFLTLRYMSCLVFILLFLLFYSFMCL